MRYKISAACGWNTGKRRGNNEDNFYFNGLSLKNNEQGKEGMKSTELESGSVNAFCVFDGMGGHADGELASLTAAEQMSAFDHSAFMENPEKYLDSLARQLNSAVFEQAELKNNDMGSTAVMLFLAADRCYLCNVGDSPAFRLREGSLKKISLDHNDAKYVEACGLTRKPRLTQFIGLSPEIAAIEPYIASAPMRTGDQYLICSDGLTDMVNTETIQAVLCENISVQNKVNKLVNKALENGGKDNITVMLIQVGPEAGQAIGQSAGTVFVPSQTPASGGDDIKTGKADRKTKITAVVLAVIVVALLALVFIPKLFKKYTVTWVNWDGAPLSTVTVKDIDSAEYSGEDPVREEDDDYTYEFSGWDQEADASGNVVRTAKYTSVEKPKHHTESWYNYNGDLLNSVDLEEGKTGEAPRNLPEREPDEKYTYRFVSWKDETDESGNITHTAQYVSIKRSDEESEKETEVETTEAATETEKMTAESTAAETEKAPEAETTKATAETEKMTAEKPAEEIESIVETAVETEEVTSGNAGAKRETDTEVKAGDTEISTLEEVKTEEKRVEKEDSSEIWAGIKKLRY